MFVRVLVTEAVDTFFYLIRRSTVLLRENAAPNIGGLALGRKLCEII